MRLFICEKPSQARDIAKVLGASKRFDNYIEGNGLKVTWCLGHLLEQAGPEEYAKDLKPWRLSVLPVIPTDWRMHPKPKTKEQLTAIKALLKEASEVVVATDADREGDVIGRELLDYFKFTGKVSRLWLSALDDASIKKALNNILPGESTYPLYLSGLGRQRADWLIGMNMTMATTCVHSHGQGALSVGRVQTPTLNLVVQRDFEIENFKPKDYWVVKGGFENDAQQIFFTTWKPTDEYTDEEGRVVNRKYVDDLLAKVNLKKESVSGTVSDFKDTKKKTRAPQCFSLSSLQKLVSSKFGYSAKETLSIAQSLYEKHKATTYPRTDCGFLPNSQFGDAIKILENLKTFLPELSPVIAKADLTFKSDVWNDKKVTAHHGIIPTLNGSVEVSTMSPQERKVYDLICRYYLAQFLGDFEYANRSVEVICEGEIFKASSNTPLVAGWKEAINKELEDIDEEAEAEKNLIPKLSKGEQVSCVSIDAETKQTKPPTRFTEGTLIDAMKNVARYVEDSAHKKLLKDNAGIGTEATRANIIELLLNREYLLRNKKQLISTEKGRKLIDLAPEMLKDPATTAKWEEFLDNIAKGEGELNSFLAEQIEALKVMLSSLSEGRPHREDSGKTYPCPQCTKPLRKLEGKYGPYWGCSGYPDCKHIMKDEGGVPVEKVVPENTGVPCKKCGKGTLIKRRGPKGDFFGCSTYPTCKAIENKLE